MNLRIFVAGEADVTHLAGLLRRQHRRHRAVRKNAVGVFQPDDFVELHQVHMVGLKTLERFINLPGGGRLGAPVNFAHQKRLGAVAVLQRLAHAQFAHAAVVIPAVVQKVDAAIQRRADKADAFGFVVLGADVVAAQADGRDFLARAAQRAIGHFIFRLRAAGRRDAHGHARRGGQLDKFTPRQVPAISAIN